MLHLCLVEPEIPQNTGNIARTAAATGAELVLVHPLGFDISEKAVRRSGLDYWKDVRKREFRNKDEFLCFVENKEVWFFSSHSKKRLGEIEFPSERDVWFVFGKESVGLGKEIIEKYEERCLRIPMLPNERCLNLSNAAAIAAYEYFRQIGYIDFV